MGYSSVADIYRDRVCKTPDLEAFSFPDASGTWHTMSWKQADEQIRRIAGGLRALGLEDEQRVSILCNTRVEWMLTDLGVMCSGGATTTIYPTTTPEGTEYILKDSDSRIVFAENAEQVDKVLSVRDGCPNLHHVVVIDGDGGHDGFVVSLDELKAQGDAWEADEANALDDIIDRITPDKLATLIYTSGTTGMPKGVELLHDGWVYIGEALEELDIIGPDDKQFLWLPMSHSFGKMLSVIMIQMGVPTAIDGTIPKIVDNLAVVRPTFMGAAPRIFEKAYNKIVNTALEAGGLRAKIFLWAVKVGRQVSKLRQQGKEPGGLLALQFGLADTIVFSKIRERFGGRIRFFISGSAPLNRDIAEFFHAAGLLILEGYGLTESSAASFVNRPDTNAFGTVGFPMPGTELRIDPDTGEIQFRSRGVMRSYYNRPDATAEALQDGWLCTGDKGELDAEGRLRITDRIKNLIKTSGGKYVAPSQIEGDFKAICSLVSEIVVHGNNRNYCTALIMLDVDALPAWGANHGLGGKAYADLTKDPKVIAEVQKSIDQLNSNLARYETIKKFHIVDEPFSIEGGELTPSLKVKRKVVEEKYADVLDGFYADALANV